jgi:asparagine synthase (glutamine-hydrolysing)
MSVQGGVWRFDGAPADRRHLGLMSKFASLHGPDGDAYHVADSIGMFYRPFHTTQESVLERQPYLSAKGNTITWDGRLDNKIELISRLSEEPKLKTDVAIVAAAIDQWGKECFPMLLGEWALAVWNPHDQALILAKDFMGTRTLFYHRTADQVCWCTVIDPIVRLTNCAWQIDRDFVAGYLTILQSDSDTPLDEIRSVPAASCVTVRPRHTASQQYWTFEPEKMVSYKEDAEYEQHFRHLFKESIRRRLRSHAPVLAELSGGLDSSSIVCTADLLMADKESGFPRLDTISYFDDEEPNWDEKPYFEKVEEQRGRVGSHVSAVPRAPLAVLSESRSYVLPGISESSILFESECANCMRNWGNRVLLSGVGGDEVLGGVPTPVPELADLIVQMRMSDLVSKVRRWALARKQPWFHLAAASLQAPSNTFCERTAYAALQRVSLGYMPISKRQERSRSGACLISGRQAASPAKLRFCGRLHVFAVNLRICPRRWWRHAKLDIRISIETCASSSSPFPENRSCVRARGGLSCVAR